jgi:hypothetical protein
MIDKSDEVFNRVMDYVMDKIPTLTYENFTSEEIDAPSVFPHIAIIQSESATDSSGQTDELVENRAMLTFDITVYSNLQNGKRSQCRVIMGHIDDYMHRMNFSRQTMAFLPNMMNNSFARMFSKYTVLADEDNFYRG